MTKFSKKVNIKEPIDPERLTIEKDDSFPLAYAFELPLESTPDDIWESVFKDEWKTSFYVLKREVTIEGAKLRVITTPDEIKEKIEWVKDLVDLTNERVGKYNKEMKRIEKIEAPNKRQLEEVIRKMRESLKKKGEPVTVKIPEAVLPGRITSGYKALDNMLLGGIPENYAIVLTSPSCDERDLLVKRFLEAGAKKGQITFHVISKASETKTLAEEFQSNFYLFICNPQADKIIKSLPNVFKLKGVENLNDISTALSSAFHRLDPKKKGPRRACIEIISDILLQHHTVQTRRWLNALIPELKSKGFTTLAVMDRDMHSPQEVHAILGLFEGEINIFEKETEKGLKKFLGIRKLYSQRYQETKMLLRKGKLNT